MGHVLDAVTHPFVHAADKTREVAANTGEKVKTAIQGPPAQAIQPQKNEAIVPPTTEVVPQNAIDTAVLSDPTSTQQNNSIIATPNTSTAPMPAQPDVQPDALQNLSIPSVPIQVNPSALKPFAKESPKSSKLLYPPVSSSSKAKISQSSTPSRSNVSSIAIVSGISIFVVLLLLIVYFIYKQKGKKKKLLDLEMTESSVKANSCSLSFSSNVNTCDAFDDPKSMALYNQVQEYKYCINPYTETYYNTPLSELPDTGFISCDLTERSDGNPCTETYYNTPLTELPGTSFISCDLTDVSSSDGKNVDVYCVDAHSVAEESMYTESF